MPNRRLLSAVLSSIFFRRSTQKASRYTRSGKSLMDLIRRVAEKSGSLGVGGSYSAARDQINLLVRMVRAYAKGEYRSLPSKTLVRLVAVLIYFVSPLDFLPDVLPVLGLTDDIALILWLVSSIGDDIEKFSQWERDRSSIKIG
ncbi:YkvA family protein [Larkinella soli]|uniref:YkvA family protein n=1 Tax=Larkinella soli TaxID=1770527 RepID=UPI0019D00528|nr:YkvA family protein [Larkinella soli]